MIRRALAVAVAWMLLTAAPDALAFCRTTTSLAPADYNAKEKGKCWDGTDKYGRPAVPLFWKNACVGYSVQKDASRKKGLSYDSVAEAISTAFTRWTGATCDTLGDGRSRTSIDVRDLGPVECNRAGRTDAGSNGGYVGGAANQNIIVFRDDSWAYGKTVLGLTTVNYNVDTGEIYDADMEINTFDMDPLAITDPVPKDTYDFLAVVTHEAGHFLGMGHSDVEGSSMFARYKEGQTFQRNLSSDDILGICSMYRPNGKRAVLDDKVYQSPSCDPTPKGGFSSKCQEKPSGLVCAGSTSPAKPAKGVAWSLAVALGVALVRRARRR